jgi:hypothetical protein
MMGMRPILPAFGLETTPERVSEVVLDIALELISKRREPPTPD